MLMRLIQFPDVLAIAWQSWWSLRVQIKAVKGEWVWFYTRRLAPPRGTAGGIKGTAGALRTLGSSIIREIARE